MKEVDGYLKRAALPILAGVVASLGLTVMLWNKSWVAVPGGALIVISMIIAALVIMRGPNYSRWAIITACVLMAASVMFAASFTNSSFAWLFNLPAWASGLVFWALLLECKGTSSSVNLVSWSVFVAMDTMVFGFIIGRFVN